MFAWGQPTNDKTIFFFSLYFEMKLALGFLVTLITTSQSSLHTKLKSKIVKKGKRQKRKKEGKKTH